MVEIIYKDVSVTAKQDSTASTSDKQFFIDLTQLAESDINIEKYATLESDFWLLDGTFESFPNTPADENFGLWSNSVSDSNGDFATPPILTLTFAEYHTSVGITLQFNRATEDFCNDLNVKWYRDTTLLENVNYEPNFALYFCSKNVENFNKIVITFNSMNNPYRYMKLQAIEYGTLRTFEADELKNVKILEEISLTSEEMSINTLDFTLNNKEDIDFIFQKKQPIIVNFNYKLIGMFFVSEAIRRGARIYDVSAEDYVGLLDKIQFGGGTYTNVLVSALIASIMGNTPYMLDSTLGAKTLSGTLEPCYCREALLQVLFAIGGVVSTARKNGIGIFSLSNVVKSKITKNRIYAPNVSYETGDIVTEVRITKNDGTTLTKKNPVINADDVENVLEFEGAFIDSSNAQTILNNLYDYYITNKNNTSNMKFINTEETVGDLIEFENEYLADKKGFITKLDYSLNSNKLVTSAVIKDMEVV